MTYDPQWKEKLEAKRAARAERMKAAEPKPVKKKVVPPVVSRFDPPKVTHETVPLGHGLEARITTTSGYQRVGQAGKEPTAQDKAGGCLVLVVLVGLFLWWLSPDDADRARAAVEASERRDAEAQRANSIFAGMENRLAWDKKWVGKILKIEGELVQTGRAESTPWAVFRVRIGENVNALIGTEEAVKVLESMRIGDKAVVSGMVRGIAKDGISVEFLSDGVERSK